MDFNYKVPNYYRKSLKTYLVQSRAAAKILKSQIDRVAGNGGILSRLNHQHMVALHNLLTQPTNPRFISRVETLIAREERVINVCNHGLSEYIKILSGLKSKGSKFYKKVIIGYVNWMLDIIKNIHSRLNDLVQRQERERQIIAARSPSELTQLIDDLKNEELDFREIITQSKPRELGRLRTLFLAWDNAEFSVMVTGLFKKDEDIGQAASLAAPLLPFSFLISILESILNILYGLSIDDKELVRELKLIHA